MRNCFYKKTKIDFRLVEFSSGLDMFGSD